MRQPAMEWRPKMGVWLLRTESPLPQWAVQKCVDFMLKIQGARRLGLLPGDTRDDLDSSVKALREGKIQQWAAGPHMDGSGEIEVFKSTAGSGKIYSMGV